MGGCTADDSVPNAKGIMKHKANYLVADIDCPFAEVILLVVNVVFCSLCVLI